MRGWYLVYMTQCSVCGVYDHAIHLLVESRGGILQSIHKECANVYAYCIIYHSLLMKWQRQLNHSRRHIMGANTPITVCHTEPILWLLMISGRYGYYGCWWFPDGTGTRKPPATLLTMFAMNIPSPSWLVSVGYQSIKMMNNDSNWLLW